jgi:hypothetical protein
VAAVGERAVRTRPAVCALDGIGDERWTAVAAARGAAAALPRVGPSLLRIGVPLGDSDAAVAVLRAHGVHAFRTKLGDTAILRRRGVQVRWAHFPE